MKNNGWNTLVILVFFLISLTIGFTIGLRSYKSINNYVQSQKSTSIQSTTVPESSIQIDKIDWSKNLLQKEKYKNFEIGTFTINGLSITVALAPLDNQVFGFYSRAYTTVTAYDYFDRDKLFAIYNNKIYILDGENNALKVYQSNIYDDPMVGPYFDLKLIKTIPGPKYSIGVMYSLQCAKANCIISSAFHQQSGCSFSLNLDTFIYSIPKCSDMSGDFQAKPL